MRILNVFCVAFLIILTTGPSHSQANVSQSDGQHDFDFEIGTWQTHLRRLVRPLSGSTEWVEYDGTSVVAKVLDGRANLVELKVAGPAGRIEGLSLRLYNPQAHQWTLNFANISNGQLTPAAIGEFKNGRSQISDLRSQISDLTSQTNNRKRFFLDLRSEI